MSIHIWLVIKAGHWNSEEFWSNPGWISQEFCGHLILKNFLVIWIIGYYSWQPEFRLRSLKYYMRILWSSNFLIRILVILLKFHKNSVIIFLLKNFIVIWPSSDQNPWKISQEFLGYLILDKNCDRNHFNDFLRIPWSSNYWRIPSLVTRLILVKPITEFRSNYWRILQEFLGHLIFWLEH